MCILVIHVLWMRTWGHRKVKLPTKFSHNWRVIEQEFQVCCLALGSMLSPTASHSQGILFVSMCDIVCVSQFQHVCMCQSSCSCVRGYECHLCDCLQMLTLMSPSQCGLLRTISLKIIHSPAYSSSVLLINL